MRMDERTEWHGRRDRGVGLERVAGEALEYLRSRRVEHWLMFVAGLAIGLILG